MNFSLTQACLLVLLHAPSIVWAGPTSHDGHRHSSHSKSHAVGSSHSLGVNTGTKSFLQSEGASRSVLGPENNVNDAGKSGAKVGSSNSNGGTSSVNRGSSQSVGGSTSHPLQITGGGNLPAQAPRDIEELKTWLADDQPRVISIDKTFDFTSFNRNITDAGCLPWAPCENGNQVQKARNFNHWCTKFTTSHKPAQVSFHQSPLEPLIVQSHKTIQGVGSAGVLRGKGLSLHLSTNVIIRNIHITELNPHIVWGGDAIAMDGASNVLIKQCTFSRIGRQMIVTGGVQAVEGNRNILIMNNHFDGITPWSPRCSNRHYWTVLIDGPGDTVTMANNCFDSTSGRSPKTGGSSSANVLVHYYNNLHTNLLGESFEIGSGSYFLAEGNVIKDSKFQDPGDAVTERGGQSYVPMQDSDTQACEAALGRPCEKNLLLHSAPYKFGLDKSVLQTFKKNPPANVGRIQPASSIINGVPGGCGVGNGHIGPTEPSDLTKGKP